MEVDYKIKFAQKYFDNAKRCDFDINRVDLILKDHKDKAILYIESKIKISDKNTLCKARTQVILTNKQQENILDKVALIYKNISDDDILELIDCDDSVMFNNDINWKAETPSNPTKDAIDRINDRLFGKITTYKNDEIKELYKTLLEGETHIHISIDNVILVFNEWKNNITFENEIRDEQDVINLFLVDMLNGTKYKKDLQVLGEKEESEQDLIREGTNLNNYDYSYNKNGNIEAIKYIDRDKTKFEIYPLKNLQYYQAFWAKYKRPPSKIEFLKILEHSARLYTDNYRKATGGEYTPSCFVVLQNKILKKHYDLQEFLIFDPCAGVGNLENQFGKDYKNSCYLSTLEQMDIDTCKIKGFDNAVVFDYLADNKEPLFKHRGKDRSISEICEVEKKKLMVIMNPPYQNKKGHKHNTAIEFFNKIVKLSPQVIVFYYMTESFLRDEIEQYINSGYKIISHNFSNAKKTFQLSEWSVSQIIFDKDKDKGEAIDKIAFTANRYEYDEKKDEFNLIKSYTYDLGRPSLLYEIDKEIKGNQQGMILGNVSYLDSVINLTNKPSKNKYYVTTKNLEYCLLSKGLIFNTHNKYFERNQYIFKGKVSEIPQDLVSDAIAFSLFYLRMAFTNKSVENFPLKNYIMPFTYEQLGCAKGELNVLEPNEAEWVGGLLKDNENPFDFRIFLSQFDFSKEAKDLFYAALQIFRFYHANPEYENKNFNDSFYDITNAIMGKNPSHFQHLQSTNDTRITKVKTTTGTKGFGRNTIKGMVASEYLSIFYHFFEMRDILARKIDHQLLDSGLLIWQRENIY